MPIERKKGLKERDENKAGKRNHGPHGNISSYPLLVHTPPGHGGNGTVSV
jgi:hypothetical protein